MTRHFTFLMTLLCCSVAAFGQSLPRLIPYNQDGQWGYSDTLGNIVLRPQWSEARLFRAGKAIVRMPQLSTFYTSGKISYQSWVYGLIDEKGNYIIPPAAGWSGDTTSHGWNVTDRLNRRGLMDNNGHLLIDYEWDNIDMYPIEGQLRKLYYVVRKGALAGIVDNQGKVIIPCRWAEITSNPSLAIIRGFIVKDPDNQNGYNAYGLVNDRNKMILEPKYKSIKLLRLPESGLVFQLGIASDNQMPGEDSYSGYAGGAVFFKYFVYPSGKEIFPADSVLSKYGRNQTVSPNGYVLFGGNNNSGLMDSVGHIIVPDGINWISGDTIFTVEKTTLATDSALVITRKINVRTLQEIAPAEKHILYVAPPEPTEYRYYDLLNHYSNRERKPRIFIGNTNVEKFYKDSFLFSVVAYAAIDYQPRAWDSYIVKGYVYPDSDTGHPYYAIIDKKGNYIVSPENQYRIIRYNEPDNIVSITDDNNRSRALAAVEDKTLQPFFTGYPYDLDKVFRSGYKIYEISGRLNETDAEQNSSSPSGYRIGSVSLKILNTDGKAEDILSKQYPSAANTMAMLRFGHIIVRDSADRIGLVTLEGVSLFPETNFKYKKLYVLNGHYFFADSGNLINSKGGKVFKNISLLHINPFLESGYRSDHDINILNSPNRLYRIEGRNKEVWKDVMQFYMSDDGKLYYANP